MLEAHSDKQRVPVGGGLRYDGGTPALLTSSC
jgi:hypothetical protein